MKLPILRLTAPILLALACLAAILFVLSSTQAATAHDDSGPPDSLAPPCWAHVGVIANLNLVGLHQGQNVLKAAPIQITAANAKLVGYTSNCESALLPLQSFTWTLAISPTGSTAVLTGTTTLTTTLTPVIAGTYVVRFTACPSACAVLYAGQTYTVPSISVSLTLTAVDHFVFPPQTDPSLPAQTHAPFSDFSDESAKCGYIGGGVINPQWVTVNPWTGAGDYQRLEGRVVKSRISRKDNFLNHDSQDMNISVIPDPIDQWLQTIHQEDMEVEWERDHFPEPFRPTPGDRVSVFGYWIHDCGHDDRTEIHPPVGIATQRPRPILLPSDQLFTLNGVSSTVGANVYVPGIVTDLWFNREAGQITGCGQTSLHQPYAGLDPGTLALTCLPTPIIGGPSPIQRKYVFDIYLPLNPQILLQSAGRTVPPVPLYYQVLKHPYGASGGPDPTITVTTSVTVTYLVVTVDLTSFTGDQYARRIVAGWVYPSPTNWDLATWKLKLHTLDVHDDGDPAPWGDGDWRFWANTNNTTQEWTKLYDCNGCVHGTIHYDPRPWQTGTPAEVSADRSLGPDLLLFPGQRIWVHTSGFEEGNGDWIVSDDTGAVNDLLPQTAVVTSTRSVCSSVSEPIIGSGCADYTLHYEIAPGSIVTKPTLTTAALALYNAYLISWDSQFICPACVVSTPMWHPFDMTMLPQQPPLPLTSTTLFAPPEPEEQALTDIGLSNLQLLITSTRQQHPDQVNRFMMELRAEADLWFQEGHSGDDLGLELNILRQGVPTDLWQQYFGDLLPFRRYLPIIMR